MHSKITCDYKILLIWLKILQKTCLKFLQIICNEFLNICVEVMSHSSSMVKKQLKYYPSGVTQFFAVLGSNFKEF